MLALCDHLKMVNPDMNFIYMLKIMQIRSDFKMLKNMHHRLRAIDQNVAIKL